MLLRRKYISWILLVNECFTHSVCQRQLADLQLCLPHQPGTWRECRLDALEDGRLLSLYIESHSKLRRLSRGDLPSIGHSTLLGSFRTIWNRTDIACGVVGSVPTSTSNLKQSSLHASHTGLGVYATVQDGEIDD